MRKKDRAEAQLAQLTEALVLAAAVAWTSWLASRFVGRADETVPAHDALRTLLPRVIQGLNLVAIAAIARALLVAQPVSKPTQDLSRHERDSGLVVGCILPPLALLSSFLVAVHDGELAASTLLSTWISVSASLSLLVKIVCCGSFGVLPTLVVDAVLLPMAGVVMGIESDLRFVLPTVARVVVALVFRFGRLALPRSFTVGEALIVAQFAGLGLFDLILITLAKLGTETVWLADFPDHFMSVWHLKASAMIEREPFQLALQVGVVGAALICGALTPLLTAYGSPSPHVVAPPLPLSPSIQFLATVGLILAVVVYPWCSLLLGTRNPVAWLIEFLLERPRRWQLIVYWLACLVICVPAFALVSRVWSLRQIVARKLFHLLAVVMFVPAFYASSEMLSLSYGVALSVFGLVECVRALSLPPLGQAIAQFVGPFIDYREGGRVILTHTYLLLGCALPVWLAHSTVPTNALAANAGVLALGVGDAMGAVVGSTYGKRKLFGRKTVEGTAAVAVSLVTASLLLHDYHELAWRNGIFTQVQFLLLLLGVVLTSLLEASTAQIDNLVLSLFLFTIANLVTCHG